MRLFILILLFYAPISFAKEIDTMCEKVRLVDKQIPIRIPDSQIPKAQKTPVFIDPDIKSGQCLVQKSSGNCDKSGVNNRTIYNSSGYTVNEWMTKYPNSNNFVADHCIYCKDLNMGNEYSNTVNATLKIFSHIIYKKCQDINQQVTSNNADGCYTFKTERVEETYLEPCRVYVCEESDITDDALGSNIYPCPVFCSAFDRPATWDLRLNGYTCRYIAPPEPETELGECETKEGSIYCLKKDVISSVDDSSSSFDNLFSNILDAIKHLFKKDVKDDQNNNDQNNNVDLSVLKQDMPVFNQNITFESKSIFPSNTTCPVDNSLNILSTNYTFSYSKLCSSLSLLSNLVMLLSFFFSYKILRGV
jgi:hypothetical protein